MQTRLRGAPGKNAWRTARDGCNDSFYSHLVQYRTDRVRDPFMVTWHVNAMSSDNTRALVQWPAVLLYLKLNARTQIRRSG